MGTHLSNKNIQKRLDSAKKSIKIYKSAKKLLQMEQFKK